MHVTFKVPPLKSKETGDSKMSEVKQLEQKIGLAEQESSYRVYAEQKQIRPQEVRQHTKILLAAVVRKFMWPKLN